MKKVTEENSKKDNYIRDLNKQIKDLQRETKLLHEKKVAAEELAQSQPKEIPSPMPVAKNQRKSKKEGIRLYFHILLNLLRISSRGRRDR